jgi:hypothetical protein
MRRPARRRVGRAATAPPLPGRPAVSGTRVRNQRPTTIPVPGFCDAPPHGAIACYARVSTSYLDAWLALCRPSGSCCHTQVYGFSVELVFDTLGRWGPGTILAWHGRSRRRWSGARSCSASTWPPSIERPPRSSRTSAPTAPGSGASCSSSGNSDPRHTADGEAATSTVDSSRPPTHKNRCAR